MSRSLSLKSWHRSGSIHRLLGGPVLSPGYVVPSQMPCIHLVSYDPQSLGKDVWTASSVFILARGHKHTVGAFSTVTLASQLCASKQLLTHTHHTHKHTHTHTHITTQQKRLFVYEPLKKKKKKDLQNSAANIKEKCWSCVGSGLDVCVCFGRWGG